MLRIRVAVAGCGSVSGPYLTDLRQSPYVEVVSVCDILAERAQGRAQEFGVPHYFADCAAMLQGPDFDLFINLTSMPSHFALNLLALQAGKYVLSEKPIASSLEEGRLLLETAEAQGVHFLGAPTVVTSPAFRVMAELLQAGEIGRVCAARALYGHSGPGWGPWFYQKGGGALFDLGVYNITTLTGLLGPVQGVVAMSGTAIPERWVDEQWVQAEAEDTIMLLMDHGEAVFSCVQSGFIYSGYREERTVEVMGTQGSVNLLGWDWHPLGVEVWRPATRDWEVVSEGAQGYSWEQGGSYLAECWVTGREPLMTTAHTFHVLEVMLAAHESAAQGKRIEVHSRFPWPLFADPVGAGFNPAPTTPQPLDPQKHRR